MQGEPTGGPHGGESGGGGGYPPEDPFSALVGRALIDEGFRQTILTGSDDDRREILRSLGASDPDEALKALKGAIEALRSLEGSFGRLDFVS